MKPAQKASRSLATVREVWRELTTLLLSIGKLKPTIGMITYRNTCALDSKGEIAYKLI